ncbi:MAG TPA: PAS domain S-box protein [Magnetovibrio sp.]
MSNAGLSGEDLLLLGELFSQGPVVVFKWVNAENWPVEFVSANVATIFGHAARAFTSGEVSYGELIHKDDLKRVASEVAKVSASGAVHFRHADYRVVRPNGEHRWVEDHTRLVRDDNGVITHYIGYVIDVTERRRIEESRRDSEARYRTMLNTTQQGYWLIDDDNLTVEANPALCRMLGYTSDELEGTSPFDYLTEDSIDTLKQQIAIRAPGDQRTYELVFKTKDGGLKRVLLHATTLPDTITSARSFALLTDISDIIETQQTLSTLWHALEQSPVGIIITDPTGAIAYANPFFTTMTGYAPGEVLGQNPRMFKSGHTEAEVYEELWKTVSSGHVWRGDLVNARKSGEIYWERQTIAPITASDGTIRHFVAFKEDISTYREAMEEQVRAKEEAQLANQAKSMFLANMSHELRTPLNAVIGFSEMMRDRMQGDLPDIYQEYAGLIYDSGTHLLHIITDILDMTKVETNRIELAEETFSLDNVAFECVTQISEKARLLNTEVHNDVPTQFRLHADRLRIKQVLLNLLSNALKSTPGGRVSISIERRFGRFAITVTDNGRGMSSDDIATALKPFGQNRRDAYRSTGEGIGLGLPIAQRLIEAHGGRLEIESVEGQGTSVSIILPNQRILSENP